jgi:hypothetical protein
MFASGQTSIDACHVRVYGAVPFDLNQVLPGARSNVGQRLGPVNSSIVGLAEDFLSGKFCAFFRKRLAVLASRNADCVKKW